MKYFDIGLRFVLPVNDSVEFDDTDLIVDLVFDLGKDEFKKLLNKDLDNQHINPCKKNGEWI